MPQVSGILGPLGLVKKKHCLVTLPALLTSHENNLKWKPQLHISPLTYSNNANKFSTILNCLGVEDEGKIMSCKTCHCDRVHMGPSRSKANTGAVVGKTNLAQPIYFLLCLITTLSEPGLQIWDSYPHFDSSTRL